MKKLLLITGIAGAGLAYWHLTKKTQDAPTVIDHDTLSAEGLTPQQVRSEQRRQRQEARQQSNTQSHATRAASQFGRLIEKVLR